MTLTVVIENAVLYGVSDDNACQRVATVYIDGDRFSVVAPAKLTGESLQHIGHFDVREPSKDALDWGADLIVTDNRRSLTLSAVEDELKRQKRDRNRAAGRTPGSIYRDAQICINGHVRSSGGLQINSGEHCNKCGQVCIEDCLKCGEPIRGQVADSFRVGYDVPSFCHACGNPYPWMEELLKTAKELLWHDEKLKLEDREKVWDCLRYVMSDPKADLVPAKKTLIGIYLAKAGDFTRESIENIIAKIAIESMKG